MGQRYIRKNVCSVTSVTLNKTIKVGDKVNNVFNFVVLSHHRMYLRVRRFP